jgi:hypothetical protein
MSSKLGERIYDLIEQGKTIDEIVAETNCVRQTAQVYMRMYVAGKNSGPTYSTSRSKIAHNIKLWEKAITRNKIEDLRRRTRVGQRINVYALKMNTDDRINGQCVMATVTDASSKHFCLVSLCSGVKEAILWSELISKPPINKGKE